MCIFSKKINRRWWAYLSPRIVLATTSLHFPISKYIGRETPLAIAVVAVAADMASLSSLVRELRERIAAAASCSPADPSAGDADPLESRFRAVLPNLLSAYVIPSSAGPSSLPLSPSPYSSLDSDFSDCSTGFFFLAAANEREVIAVLKLVSHSARTFPGIFFRGRAAAVVPVIGRILPFFAEPSFRWGVGLLHVFSLINKIGNSINLLAPIRPLKIPTKNKRK